MCGRSIPSNCVGESSSMKYRCTVYKEDCSPIEAEDTSLPLNSYLVKYEDEGAIKFDIVISHKRVDVFDFYYDNYAAIHSIEWTKGKVNPKLWSPPKQEKKKK